MPLADPLPFAPFVFSELIVDCDPTRVEEDDDEDEGISTLLCADQMQTRSEWSVLVIIREPPDLTSSASAERAVPWSINKTSQTVTMATHWVLQIGHIILLFCSER